MTRLAYCVLSESDRLRDVPLVGVEGAPVSLAVAAGLAVASSPVREDALPPTLPRVRAYAHVVESLHSAATVLPFRYGCFVKNGAELEALLAARGRQFEAALRQLHDCEEMTVRVLLEDPAPAVRGGPAIAPAAASGAAYLAGLRDHYSARESLKSGAVATAEALRLAFRGLYVKIEADPSPSGGGPLLSVHFLVFRKDVGRFREAFERLQATGAARMLLTGPWPLYHFAGVAGGQAEDPQGVPAIQASDLLRS
jgi:hypothetical protein